jgi:hypothetical protein
MPRGKFAFFFFFFWLWPDVGGVFRLPAPPVTVDVQAQASGRGIGKALLTLVGIWVGDALSTGHRFRLG